MKNGKLHNLKLLSPQPSAWSYAFETLRRTVNYSVYLINNMNQFNKKKKKYYCIILVRISFPANQRYVPLQPFSELATLESFKITHCNRKTNLG